MIDHEKGDTLGWNAKHTQSGSYFQQPFLPENQDWEKAV